MNNEVKQLLLADGQSMPQEGFGLYKITDQSTITSAIKYAYNAGYRLLIPRNYIKTKQRSGTLYRSLAYPVRNFSLPQKYRNLIKGLSKQSPLLKTPFKS